MKIKPASKKGEVVLELNHRDDQLMEESVKAAERKNSPFRIKGILVPIDFSRPSEKALEYAVPLAAKFEATITLIHVVEPRIYPEDVVMPPELEDIHISMLKKTRERLEALRQEKINPRVPSKAVVQMGIPYQQISAAAEALETDLIIIATHGYSGLKHFFLGSTAERVVRHAPCPVLTVREGEHDFV